MFVAAIGSCPGLIAAILLQLEPLWPCSGGSVQRCYDFWCWQQDFFYHPLTGYPHLRLFRWQFFVCRANISG
ncbi:MAG: hypothetical protein CSA52_00225 [Gammaproteobacteria bacterium]|nr:MAG: hypothetical protein CSA52_00225 [Gammaproteobacteria bacterium]